MKVRLNKAEVRTLTALDPSGSGHRNWYNAREAAGGIFEKDPEQMVQTEIRVARNAFRKLVREELLEMGVGELRGMYRITEKGRKTRDSGETDFDSIFDRGEISKMKSDQKSSPKKASTKKSTKKKSTKKKAAKKKAVKKAASKKTAPKKDARAPVIERTPFPVEDQSATSTVAQESDSGGNGESSPLRRRFRRRNAPAAYGEDSASN